MLANQPVQRDFGCVDNLEMLRKSRRRPWRAWAKLISDRGRNHDRTYHPVRQANGVTEPVQGHDRPRVEDKGQRRALISQGRVAGSWPGAGY